MADAADDEDEEVEDDADERDRRELAISTIFSSTEFFITSRLMTTGFSWLPSAAEARAKQTQHE